MMDKHVGIREDEEWTCYPTVNVGPSIPRHERQRLSPAVKPPSSRPVLNTVVGESRLKWR